MVVRKVITKVRRFGVRHAFTLVELLVAIAIVVLLSAIAFGVSRHARESARLSSCSSNLGQIGKALLLYADDNDSLAPPLAVHAHVKIFGQTRQEIIGDPQRFRATLLQYARDTRIFYCPSDAFARTHRQMPTMEGFDVNHFYTSYNMPLLLSATGWRITESGVPLLNIDAQAPFAYLQDSILYRVYPGAEHQTGHGPRAVAVRTDGSIGVGKVGP